MARLRGFDEVLQLSIALRNAGYTSTQSEVPALGFKEDYTSSYSAGAPTMHALPNDYNRIEVTRYHCNSLTGSTQVFRTTTTVSASNFDTYFPRGAMVVI